MPSDVESPMWTTARQEVRNPDAAADVPGLALPGGQRAAAGLLAAACFRPVLAGALLAEVRPGGEGRLAPPAREAPPVGGGARAGGRRVGGGGRGGGGGGGGGGPARRGGPRG